MSRHALAVDIGGTKILVGLVDESGAIAAQHQVPTPARDGADAVLGAVVDACRTLLSQAAVDAVACGVGTAGVVGSGGTIVSATDLIRGWLGARVGQRLTAAFGLPVTVLNDVHATGVCEARIGAAAGKSSALIVAVGTGIGGSVVANGSVVPGSSGIAGSIGHMLSPLRRGAICSCGALDHIEAHASGPAIEAEFRARSGRSLGLPAIAALGDRLSSEVITEAAEALGATIGTAVNLLDPEIVVVGGGVAGIGPRFFDGMRNGMARHALPPARAVPIVPARQGAQSCMLGAALAALASTAPSR